MSFNHARYSRDLVTDSDIGELTYTVHYNGRYEDNSINTPIGDYKRIDFVPELVGVEMFGKEVKCSNITKQILEDIIAEEHDDG